MFLKGHIERWMAYVVYAAIALLILLPLLGRGYILTLDMVFTPHISWPVGGTNSYLFWVLLHGLNQLLPSDVIEKLLLFAILLLAGVGMHRLVRNIDIHCKQTDRQYVLGAYVAGMLYMVNPFTYERLMAGQYAVLFGYALLPWLARALLIFLERPALKRTLKLALWLAAVGIVSIHLLGMALLLVAIPTWLALWRRRGQDEYLPRLVRYSLLAMAIFLVASSYWIVPLLLGKNSTAVTIDAIGSGDRLAFATVGHGLLGQLGNVLRLQGFWLETRQMFILPQDYSRAWGLLVLLVWTLVIMGAVSYWRNGQRLLVVAVGPIGLLAVLLAAGIANGWLSSHIPFFAGYREPQKFVALLALIYCIFVARGASTVGALWTANGGRFGHAAAVATMLALPFAYTPVILWGCNNQLHTVNYPTDWFAVDRRLANVAGSSQTLFLPWHLYMYYGFAGRIIANPAPKFFGVPMLVSDNPEYGGASSIGSHAQHTIDRLLPSASQDRNFASELAELHVQYVLLAKEDDFVTYAYLDHVPGLRRIVSSPTLELYRNDTYK